MRLIGVAFYEPDLDWLEVWSPDIFGEMMATINAVMQEDLSFRQISSTLILSGSYKR